MLLKVECEGVVVASHVWLTFGRRFHSAVLLPGDLIQFDARVKQYEKGYKGRKLDVYKPVSKDYGLSYPTKIKVLIRNYRRLVQLGEMTPAGLAAAPDLDPSLFVFEDWVLDALRADELAWANYISFPETYRRIRVDYIQHYRQTGRAAEAQKALSRFVKDCHAGKMLPGWDDFGRLK